MFPTPSFDNKRVGERKKFTMDFVNELAAGETITTCTVTAVVVKGTDASPGAIVSGTTTVAGSKCTQLIIDGVDGVTYLLVYEIVTSNSQTLHGAGLLTVSNAVT